MGAVIMALTVALALARTSIATNMRKILPWVNRISGVLLVLSGVYLVIYGWWEIQVLRGNISQNALVSFFENMQANVNVWINQTGAARLGFALLVIVGLALLRGLWADLSTNSKVGGVAAVALLWLLGESGLLGLSPNFADLFILPIIRTILDIPMRIGNWFTEGPLRWTFLGEVFVLSIVGMSLWFRFGRKSEKVDDPEQLVNA